MKRFGILVGLAVAIGSFSACKELRYDLVAPEGCMFFLPPGERPEGAIYQAVLSCQPGAPTPKLTPSYPLVPKAEEKPAAAAPAPATPKRRP